MIIMIVIVMIILFAKLIGFDRKSRLLYQQTPVRKILQYYSYTIAILQQDSC